MFHLPQPPAINPWITVVKPITETMQSNSSVLTPDRHLRFPVKAGHLYQVKLCSIIYSDATVDFKQDWDAPAGSQVVSFVTRIGGASAINTVYHNFADAANAPNPYANSLGGSVKPLVIDYVGFYRCWNEADLLFSIGNDAGEIAWKWCQNSSQAYETPFVYAGSYIMYIEIPPGIPTARAVA